MTLPNLPPERLDQMIYYACSCSQDACTRGWYKRVVHPMAQRMAQHISRPVAYGMGATALSASCIALFLALPATKTQTVDRTADITISDYMMQDLLESLT